MKYLFFDIDGTLTTGTSEAIIPESTRLILKQLQKKHFVAIATGRPYFLCKEICEDLEINHIVCNCGNTVFLNGERIFDEVIDQKECVDIVRQCERLKLPYCLNFEEKFQYYTTNPLVPTLIKHPFLDQKIDVIENYETFKDQEIHRIMIACNSKQLKQLSFNHLVPQSYGEDFIMIEPGDKYLGIQVMMNAMNAPMEEVVVFGDGLNDVAMFKQAPISIAMGNAHPELKRIATQVTDSNMNHGIEKAVKIFNWL